MSTPVASTGALRPSEAFIVSETIVQRPSSCLRTPSIVPGPSATGFVSSGLVRGAPAQPAITMVRHTLASHRRRRYLIRVRVTAFSPRWLRPVRKDRPYVGIEGGAG